MLLLAVGALIGVALTRIYFAIRSYLFLRKLKRQTENLQKDLDQLSQVALQRLKDMKSKYGVEVDPDE